MKTNRKWRESFIRFGKRRDTGAKGLHRQAKCPDECPVSWGLSNMGSSTYPYRYMYLVTV